MPTAFQLRTLPEILAQMFATARVLLGEDIDLNTGSILRTLLEASALQDAEQYIQIARLLDLFSLDEARGDDLDRRALDYGADVFTDLRRRAARTSITQVTAGDATLEVKSKLVADIAAGVTNFDVIAGEGANYPVSGSVVLGRGTERSESVIYTRLSDTFTLVSPAVTVNPHVINEVVEQISIKSLLAAAVASGAGTATLEVGTEAAWPSSGDIIFERDTVRREILPFTRSGVTLTLTGVTAFAHDDATDVILSTNGSDRNVAAGATGFVPATVATVQVNYRTTVAATLLDGDITSGLIDTESELAGVQSLVGANTISRWQSDPFTSATINNPFASVRGRNRESDDTYRQRIRDFVQSLSRATALAIETLVAGQTDPFSNRQVVFAQVVEPIAPGESILYVTDGSTTFAIDFQVFSGRDVLISDADAGDKRARLHQFAPFKKLSSPVEQRTPRIFVSVDRGDATSVGANFVEDTTQAFTVDEHANRFVKTDDDQFFRILSNTAIRLVLDAGGVTPSFGAYSVFEFGVARETLTLTGNAADTNTVVIDAKIYTFQTVLTNTDGNVFIGATASDSIDNLIAAITLGAGAGTLYAAATSFHPTVTVEAAAGDTMLAEAKQGGTAGNSIATTETLVSGSWGDTTMSGGAEPLEPDVDYIFNRSKGDLELITALLDNDALVAADDGSLASVGAYTFTRGLAAFVQRLVNGDRDAIQDFPGIKATGTQVCVIAPVVISPIITIQVITVSGTTDADLMDTVQSVVQAYVNSLGIGDNIILSEIIRLVKNLAGVADVAITAAEGQGGGDITIEGHPLCISPGFPAVVARSEKLTYDDHGMQWNLAEKNGFYSPFEYAS